jgi:hypothetical protein
MNLWKVLFIGMTGQLSLTACAEFLQEKVHDTKHIEQQIDFIQSDGVNRFIIVMKDDKNKQIQAQNLKILTSALTEGNAQNVESLDGNRILLVISNKEAVRLAASKTGLIESVTLDQAIAPNIPAQGQD